MTYTPRMSQSSNAARLAGGRGALRLLGKAALALGVFIVLIEALLRLASFFVDDPSAKGWRPNSSIRILAVGDSHTYGGSVPKGQEYPAQLQRFLDEAAPGRYSVLNVGIPGTNTSQVRHRLSLHLARWEPDLVLLWCGVNNTWNRAEKTKRPSPVERLDGLAVRSRLYRLARVWINDWRMMREVEVSGGRHVVSAAKVRELRPVLELPPGERSIDFETTEWTSADYEAMVQIVRGRGIPIVFITYPLDYHSFFLVPNRAMRLVADRLDVPIVNTTPALERVPPSDEERFSWALHPSGRLYGEIAQDVAALVLSLDF